ncbi:MAG: hypothetical protein QOH58_7 [Thermoleophilaceae bacterium]|jgi:quercetin dioxygenase-like cupin family protein|nr:hypothetical protein [Thermoleophilaceae bacterium]
MLMPIVITHAEQPVAEWRKGNRTRLDASEALGTKKLATGEQWFEPGTGAPVHSHPDGLEEIIVVLSGRGEFSVDGQGAELAVGQTLIVPPWAHHGFQAVGDEVLNIWAAFSSPAPPTVYDADPERVILFGAKSGAALDANRRVGDTAYAPTVQSPRSAPLLIANADDQPNAQIRPGNLMTRLLATGSLGSSLLTVGEQIFERGSGAPTHYHPEGIEETVTVLTGRGDFSVDGQHVELEPGQTIVFPVGSHHGFMSLDDVPLHIRAAFSGPSVPTVYDDATDDLIEFGGPTGATLDATRTKRTIETG